MTLFDYLVLLIVGVSIGFSLMRGLVREVLSLASWIGAFFVARFGAPVVADWLPRAIAHQGARFAVGFVLVMIASVLLFSLISLQLAKIVKLAGLTGTDRVLGALFGFARGLLVTIVLVLVAGLTPLPQERFWREALFSPSLETAAGWLRPWLPKDVRSRMRYEWASADVPAGGEGVTIARKDSIISTD